MVVTGAHADDPGASAPADPPVIPAAPSPVPARAFPSIYRAASAIPAPGGTAFVGLTCVNPRDGISGRGGDGDLSFGYTFGSPVDTVSVTLAATFLCLGPIAVAGGACIGLSRMLRVGGNSATFIGASSSDWGYLGRCGVGKALSNAVYIAHLGVFHSADGSERPVQLTLGYGDNSALSDIGNGVVDGGVCHGVGVGVTQKLSLSPSGTGTQVNMGLGLTVPSVPGPGKSGGALDVTDNANRQHLSLTATFTF